MTLERRTPLRSKPRRMKTFRCEECRTPFQRRADWKPRNQRGAVLCTPCSRRDRVEGRTYPQLRTGKTLTCKTCGGEFYRQRYALSSAKFCSGHCKLEWQRTHGPPPGLIGSADNSGSRNGRYRDGSRVGEHINKPDVRKAVISRDGDWCLICGKPPRGLHLHRIIYGSQGGEYEVGNCVQLCGEHHGLVHSNKRVWQPRLLAHIADPATSEFRHPGGDPAP
jgi:hypothetical protein